jgi:hypothetical protein
VDVWPPPAQAARLRTVIRETARAQANANCPQVREARCPFF